jgi:hypothetical protein
LKNKLFVQFVEKRIFHQRLELAAQTTEFY